MLQIIELQDQLKAMTARVKAMTAREQAQSAVRSRLIVQYADRLAAAEAENAALRLELQRRSASVAAVP